MFNRSSRNSVKTLTHDYTLLKIKKLKTLKKKNWEKKKGQVALPPPTSNIEAAEPPPWSMGMVRPSPKE